MKRLGAACLGLAALAACSDPPASIKPPEPAPPRRVIDPPGSVRPLPPYAISSQGVGPFGLDASLAAMLYELPSGPRMLLLDVPGLVKQNVIRAEDDAILVSGSVMGNVSVVAVVKEAVALTESGIAVGSKADAIAAELALDDPRVARDPRLAALRRLPAARLILRDDAVAAIALSVRARAGAAARAADAKAPARCGAARASDAEQGPWVGACLSTSGEVVRTRGDEVLVRSGDGKERPIAALRVRGLLFARPLAVDDRDDLVVVSKGVHADDVVWTVATYRLDAGRLVRTAEQQVYKLSADGARWIGISLEEAEIYLELVAGVDAIEVGGFLVISTGTKIRDVVALREVSVSRRRGGQEPTSAPALEAP